MMPGARGDGAVTVRRPGLALPAERAGGAGAAPGRAVTAFLAFPGPWPCY